MNSRHIIFVISTFLCFIVSSAFVFMGGVLDLNVLENYANQDIPFFAETPNTPADNQITDEIATLGRVLFYDTQLSLNNTVSCGSCHKQELAFGDTSIVSKGFDGKLTERHSMRLVNISYKDVDSVFWDRRASKLEDQPAITIANPIEMGFSGEDNQPDLDSLIRRLEQIEYYQDLFEFAYGESSISMEKINKALAQFVRSIISFDSKFDAGLMLNGGDPFDSLPNLTEQESFGKFLFISPFPALASPFDTNPPPRQFFGCFNCHGGSSFSQSSTLRGNNGVLGVAGDSTQFDFSVIRSPSLKNMFTPDGEELGPFMHDGSLKTLRDVLKHYAFIPFNPANTNLAVGVGGGGLPFDQRRPMTVEQEDALIAFMKTLTGRDVFTNPKWSNPFDENGNITVIKVCSGNAVTTKLEITICEGESVFGYSAEGEYTDTFTAANGCDSIQTLILNVLPQSVDSIMVQICEGEEYNGNNETGTYTEIQIDVNGCDSITIIDLEVLDLNDPDCMMVITEETVNKNMSFEIYPNPFKNQVKIKGVYEGFLDFRIYNTIGKLVQNGRIEMENGFGNVNTISLNSGLFILTLIDPISGLSTNYNVIKSKK